MRERTFPRWFEDYRCGCVSLYVERKRELLGYCPIHGENRRKAWHVRLTAAELAQEPDLTRQREG